MRFRFFQLDMIPNERQMMSDIVAVSSQDIHTISTVRNFIVDQIEGTEKDIFIGRPLDEIKLDLEACTGQWPRRVGTDLFALIGEKVYMINDAPALISWLTHRGVLLDWRSNSKGSYIKLPGKADLIAYLKTSAREYCSIHDLPHCPQITTAFYSPKADIKPRETGAFIRLLKYFNPATEDDKIFMAALFLTPFWGGQPGGRPMFVLEGPENDPDGGRGVGKSELVDILAMLSGGYIDVPESIKDPDEIKKRIINSDGPARIVRYDNVKKNRWSSSVFESLITSSSISGHRLYLGHGVKPNHFTYVVTFNDASLSKDLATRAVRIRLARPEKMTASWAGGIRDFVNEHRRDILSEILWYLEQPGADIDLEFRFPAWVRGVLAKVAGETDQAMLQKIIVDKTSMDDEMAEIDDIEQVIHNRLSMYSFMGYNKGNFDPNKQNMFISWTVMAKWLREDMGMHDHARGLSKKINRSGSQRLEVRRLRGCKGAMWVAPETTDDQLAFLCPPDPTIKVLADETLHKVYYNA